MDSLCIETFFCCFRGACWRIPTSSVFSAWCDASFGDHAVREAVIWGVCLNCRKSTGGKTISCPYFVSVEINVENDWESISEDLKKFSNFPFLETLIRISYLKLSMSPGLKGTWVLGSAELGDWSFTAGTLSSSFLDTHALINEIGSSCSCLTCDENAAFIL